jgi:hypothetical protein
MSEVIADTAAPETAPQTETIAPTSAPEVAAAETPAEAPAPNIDDELSAIFRKANPDREPDGKYAAKDKPEEPTAPAVEIPPMPAALAKANEEIWRRMEPEARALFIKREIDGDKGVAQLKQQLEPIKGLAAAIEPHRAMLTQNGLTAEAAVQRLISAHEAMSGPNKHHAIVHLAEQYGVDLPRMFGPQGQRPGQNAFVDNLVAKINRLEAAAAAQEQAQVQTAQKTLTSEIESFSKKPEYEHFETLKPEMAKLLIAGVADGLEDAYDKAARLNKDVFTQIQSKSQKAAEDKARAEAAKKAASLNVKSSSANSASPKPIDDQLREIYRRSQAS